MKKKKWNKSRRAFLAFLLPSFLGVVFFVLLPFLDVFKRSFTTAVTGEFVGIQNYVTVYENRAFRLAVGNTLRFTLVCLPLLLVLGLLAALLLTNMKQAQLLKSFFLLPMAMPAATIVLIWKMTFSESGFLNRLLSAHTDYMGTSLAFWVLVFSYVWKNLGYTVVLWLAGILAIPEDYIQAAKVDGAGKVRIFFSIILPQLKGCMYTITVLSFLNSFKVFRESYLVSGAYPHESMYLLQHLFNNWYGNLDVDKMCAGAVMMAILVFILILLMQKIMNRGDRI